jgi:hypothetical protein
MRNRRIWQVSLSVLLLLGAADALHALLDLETTIQLEQEALRTMTGREVPPSSPSVFMLVGLVTLVSLALGWLLVWRGIHLPPARALLAFILLSNLPLFSVAKWGLLSVQTTIDVGSVTNVLWLMALVAFAATFPKRLSRADLAAALPPSRDAPSGTRSPGLSGGYDRGCSDRVISGLQSW